MGKQYDLHVANARRRQSVARDVAREKAARSIARVFFRASVRAPAVRSEASSAVFLCVACVPRKGAPALRFVAMIRRSGGARTARWGWIGAR